MSKPLEHYSYTLTPSDALAWEMLPRHINAWQKAALIAIVVVAAAAISLMPVDWIGERWSLRFIATTVAVFGVMFALFASIVTQRRYRAAQRRVPIPQAVGIEVWPDQLVVLIDGAERSVRFEDITKVITTPTHVMLALREAPLVMPRIAFANDAVMQGFAARIGQASRAAARMGSVDGTLSRA